jgi:hypothetical protein
MATRTISTKLQLDGEAEYRASLKNINSELGTLKSELKLTESQFAGHLNSYAALSAKGETLAGMYDQQEKKLAAINKILSEAKDAQSKFGNEVQSAKDKIAKTEAALNALADAEGDTSEQQAKLTAELEEYKTELATAEANQQKATEAVNKYQTQANSAEAELNKLGNEIDENNKCMDEAAKSSDKCADSVDKYSGKVKKADEDTEKFSEKLKTGLVAGATAAAAAFAAISAAAVKLGVEVVTAYADYEQLVGGVETLFQDSSGKVLDYANNAYKTAGLSANEYMETVTSFSASLLSSLGGDTEKAADYPWTISLVTPSDAMKSEVRYAKNMTSMKKTVDASGIANRIYALGYGEGVNQLTIAGVNGGKPYVEDAMSIQQYGLCSTILVDSRYEVAENLKGYAEQMLAELKNPYVSYEIGAIDLHRLTGDTFSKFRPGEIVRVVDEADGINLRTRIVSVEKSDAQGDPGSVTVTIANKSKDIAGSISELQNRALINETYAQGATNQQIYNFTDNADATHPATLKLYISDSVVRINKMLLNIQFEAFRAYEKAIGGGGGQTTSSGGGQTTSSGGGSTTSSGGGSTTSSGGGTTSSSTSLRSSNTINSSDNGGSGGENHNHGLARGDRLALIDYNNNIIGGVNFVPSGAHTHPGHTHTVGSHTHSVSAHTHRVSAHTHTVKAHTHTVQDHTHKIEFGIYEGARASSATIKVDGVEIPAPASYDNLDIVEYLKTDGSGKIQRNAWHTIQILPNSMSRIVGAVFMQTFCNSRGGGDY